MWAYKVQIHRSLKVSGFSLAPTQAPPEPNSIVPKRTNLETDEYIASHMYALLERRKCATKLRKEADENVQLAQKVNNRE